MVNVERVPVEILNVIFEHVVLSGSITDDLKSASNVKLSQVNSFFRAVALSTPILWGAVSNKQSPEVLHLCLERSKESNLRVALLLVDFGTDSYVDFLKTVVPHCSRWEEFHFETGRGLSDYLRVIYDLPNHCHGLRLPRLSSLAILYPDPTCYDTDEDDGLDVNDLPSYTFNTMQSRNHFYCTWVTPKLRQLTTRNIAPCHTENAQLTTFEVQFQATCPAEWRAEPLLTMYPHWAELRSLTIQCHDDVLYTQDSPDMGNVVLQHLQNLSLSFSLDDASEHIRPWFFGILDYPNVMNIDLKLYIEKRWPHYRPEEIRTLLRDKTDYAKLEHIRLSLCIDKNTVSTTIFERNMDITSAERKSTPSITDYASPGAPGVESIACVKELSSILQRRSGWHGLSEIILVNGVEERVERFRAEFPGWHIHYQLQQVDLDAEVEYEFADDGHSRPSTDSEGWTTDSSDISGSDEEDDIFVA